MTLTIYVVYHHFSTNSMGHHVSAMTLHHVSTMTLAILLICHDFNITIFPFHLKSFHISDIRLLLRVSRQHHMSASYTQTPTYFKEEQSIYNLRLTSLWDIVQELCESRGGRPELSFLTSLQVSVDVKNY